MVEEAKRPIWNIAHMVNSLSDVDQYLDKGANALEFDIQFDTEGNATRTHHGFPCDFARKWWDQEDVDKYLDKMQKLTTPGYRKYRQELVLLFLDLKIAGLPTSKLKQASESLAIKLIEIYWKKGTVNPQAYLILAIPSLKQIKFVKHFLEALQETGDANYKEKIGFTFFGNEDVRDICFVLSNVEANVPFWQADGITNWLPRGSGRLEEMLEKRDKGKNPHFNKVYSWTVDMASTMRGALSLGVDAITTNYPDNLAAVLKEDEFSKYLRLANINDDPWKRYSI